MNSTIAQIVMSLNARIVASRDVADWIFGFHMGDRITSPHLHGLLVRAFTAELLTEFLNHAALFDGLSVDLDTRDVLAAYALLAHQQPSDNADTRVRRRALAALVVEGVRRGITPGNVGIASCVEGAFQAVAEIAANNSDVRQYATARREWDELWSKSYPRRESDRSRSATAAVMAVLSSGASWFRDAAEELSTFGIVPGDPREADETAELLSRRLTTADRETLDAWRPVDTL